MPERAVRIECTEGIATVWLDRAHWLGLQHFREITGELAILSERADLKLLVVRSNHPRGFGSGFAAETIRSLRTDTDRIHLAAAGQRLTDQIRNAAVPSLAVVRGRCCGPAFELALACDYRLGIATMDGELGFPDVVGGLLPCLGATSRLIELIGRDAAARLLSTDQTISVRTAHRLGLLDRVCSERRAMIEYRSFVDELTARGDHRRRTGWWTRRCHARQVRQIIPERKSLFTKAISMVVRAAQSSPVEGRAAERSWFATSAGTDAVRNLAELNQDSDAAPLGILPHRVAIFGDGPGDLAARIALQGSRIDWFHGRTDAARAALTHFHQQGLITPLEAQQAGERIRATTNEDDLHPAEWVMTSPTAFESFEEWEPKLLPRTVVTVVGGRISTAQTTAVRPGRLTAIVPGMIPGPSPLYEVLIGALTHTSTVHQLDGWLRALRCETLLASDESGAMLPRIAAAYFDEAVRVVSEGIPADAVDAAVRGTGAPMGPLAQLDCLGLDTVVAGVRRLMPLLAAGFSGRAAGRGFYRYRRGRIRVNSASQMLLWDARAIDEHRPAGDRAAALDLMPRSRAIPVALERIMLRTVNETVACLAAEKRTGAARLDAAVARGLRVLMLAGGPLRHADHLGLAATTTRLASLATRYGPRFHPHPELIRRAIHGQSFYAVSGMPALQAAAA